MPRDGNESDFLRVLYGMFVFWSEVMVYELMVLRQENCRYRVLLGRMRVFCDKSRGR